MNINEIDRYDLGIIWAIGSHVEESRFVFRHKDIFFLERLKPYFKNNIYEQKRIKGKDGIQFVLKTSAVDVESLRKLGWTERNSDARNLPVLPEYKDFLRAFIEIHSTLDYSTRYKRSGSTYKALRLRIYGNSQIIDGINNLLAVNVGIGVKTPQLLRNGKTSILYYQATSEINAVYDYLKGDPCFEKYWDDVAEKFKTPRID
ncbi:MAG: hypothetical protein JJE18_04460 [Eubacteriaceae bacterium]|nr:hypothetical protein [Eubacteriaceae bacterium]